MAEHSYSVYKELVSIPITKKKERKEKERKRGRKDRPKEKNKEASPNKSSAVSSCHPSHQELLEALRSCCSTIPEAARPA